MSKTTKNLNTHPSEFKESDVKLAVESGQSIARAAEDLGVNVNTLHTWIGRYSKPKKLPKELMKIST